MGRGVLNLRYFFRENRNIPNKKRAFGYLLNLWSWLLEVLCHRS
jgi:hypothetical protein